MKIKHLFLCCILSFGLGSTSCVTPVKVQSKTHKEKSIPPGQVKKITGNKSAAPYAPGHHK